jgi:predicted amidophosphoribosyltransferase
MNKICPNCQALSEDNETLCNVCGNILSIMYYIYSNNFPVIYTYWYE